MQVDSGNIALITDLLGGMNGVAFQALSAGSLTVETFTAGGTIGIGGGAGTLQLASSLFSTNFVDGFSEIVVGDSAAGNINISGITNYNDPLTFKTANTILLNIGSSLVGGVGQNAHLTLWADADTNSLGGIALFGGSSINTNNGNIVMGGGIDPSTGYAHAEALIGRSGIYVEGDITAGSGTVTMHGYADALNRYGIQFLGGTLSGSGTMLIDGITNGTGIDAVNTWAGVGFRNPGVRLSASDGDVTINGLSNGSGWSHGISVNQAIVETTGAGSITFNASHPNGGSGGWGASVYTGATVRSTALGGGDLNFNVTSGDWGMVIGEGSTISLNSASYNLVDQSVGGFSMFNGAANTLDAGTNGNISLAVDANILLNTAGLWRHIRNYASNWWSNYRHRWRCWRSATAKRLFL